MRIEGTVLLSGTGTIDIDLPWEANAFSFGFSEPPLGQDTIDADLFPGDPWQFRIIFTVENDRQATYWVQSRE